MKTAKIAVLIISIAIPSWSFAWSGRGVVVRPGFNRGFVGAGFVGGVPSRFFFNRFLFPRPFYYPGFYSYSYPYYPSGYVYPYVYQSYTYPMAYDISPPPPAATPEGAYDRGYSEGYSQGYEQGQKDREKQLFEEGKKRGYDEGYNAGKDNQNP